MNANAPIDLTSLNTFRLKSKSFEFYSASSDDQLLTLFQTGIFAKPFKILGGGSNIILPEVIQVPVLKIENKGIRILEETGSDILVKVKAGENWHNFVCWTLESNYYGAENLSLIPGTVGAAPIQNIGAYGVEVKDLIEEVICFDTNTGKFVILTNEDCQFAYRDSLFKKDQAQHLIVWEVNFRLSKVANPKTTYGDIHKELEKNGWPALPSFIANAVINLRQTKLPDPNVIGNAGSFFKNPIITADQHSELQQKHPHLISYPHGANFKLAAGWLIEQAGWKGKKLGPVGMYEKQALVMVNYGGASAQDVWALARQVQNDVYEKFNVQLEPEPIQW